MQQRQPEVMRCEWCGKDPDYISYHDEEWGIPLRDSQRLFEFLVLEGAQAGLSWITILRKREGYRAVFDAFNPESLAAWSDSQVEDALRSPLIVRNRLKVNSVRQNAQAVMSLRESGTTLCDYLWHFVDDEPLVNHWGNVDEVPARTDLSSGISKDMKKRGFAFIGPTVMYAFMQATGMVNDHITGCFRHPDSRKEPWQ